MSSSAAKATVDALLRRVDAAGALKRNIVAFSGGVDSSLVAALVQEAHPRTSVACIGRSAALPTAQLELAQQRVETRRRLLREGAHRLHI